MSYASVFNMPNISFRFFNVYGPRLNNSSQYSSVFGIFLLQKSANKPITIIGKGNQTRDFLYIDDLLDGILKSINLQGGGHLIHLASGIETSVNEIVNKLNIYFIC